MKTSSDRLAIALRLRRAREAAGLSQGQVAKKMEMHRPTISEIEAGRRKVAADELARFAGIYGITADWLTEGDSRDQDAANDRLVLAARQLSKLKDEDLDRLMSLIRMLRHGDRT